MNGVCLTATDIDGESFEADAMTETLTRSSLAGLQAGAKVNLELPLRAGRAHGRPHRAGPRRRHGHGERDPRGGPRAHPRDRGPGARLARYLVEKGSVALDGVSLTVSAITENGFEVSLIPETLRRTNLGSGRGGRAR